MKPEKQKENQLKIYTKKLNLDLASVKRKWERFPHHQGYAFGRDNYGTRSISSLRMFNYGFFTFTICIFTIIYYISNSASKQSLFLQTLFSILMILQNLIVVIDVTLTTQYRKYTKLWILVALSETLMWILIPVTFFLPENSSLQTILKIIIQIQNLFFFLLCGILPIIRDICYCRVFKGGRIEARRRGRRGRRVRREAWVAGDMDKFNLFITSPFYIAQFFFLLKMIETPLSDSIPNFFSTLPLTIPFIAIIFVQLVIAFIYFLLEVKIDFKSCWTYVIALGLILGIGLSGFFVYSISQPDNTYKPEGKNTLFKILVVIVLIAYIFTAFLGCYRGKKSNDEITRLRMSLI